MSYWRDGIIPTGLAWVRDNLNMRNQEEVRRIPDNARSLHVHLPSRINEGAERKYHRAGTRNPKENYGKENYAVKITGQETIYEGGTAHFDGMVQFNPKIKHIKWQKYKKKNRYIDIDIRNQKYKGSTNDLRNPKLHIHNVNQRDEVKYRLEVKIDFNTVHSNLISLRVDSQDFSVEEDSFLLGTPGVKLSTRKETYFVGEKIVIDAHFQNPSRILCALWQRETRHGSEAIDVSLPKYNETDEHMLCINDCDENDLNMGPYFLQAVCSGDNTISSNRIPLSIAMDFLKVDLQISAKFEPVAYGSKIELEAWIQSYPLPTGFQWWKNHEVIIPDGRKIFEDKSDVKNPKLRIENVDTSDSGNYGITVTNPLRSVEEHKDLKVVGVGIEGMEIIAKGETAHFSGKVQFHPKMKHLKWQKYRNDRYIDIEIRNQKYHGSTNELRNPKLEIRNVDSDDETKYRLEVKTDLSTIHSNAISLKVILHPEIQRIRLTPKKELYFVGEKIVIDADICDLSSVLCALWQRNTRHGSEAIDVSLPKYNGTDEHMLCINDCDEKDLNMGPYFLQAVCSGDNTISSNMIHLNIAQEKLSMALSYQPRMGNLHVQKDFVHERKVIYHGSVELAADIKSTSNVLELVWMKGLADVDFKEKKYEGSYFDGNHSVLCINKVTKNDEDIYSYKIKSQNDFVEMQNSEKLKITVIAEIPKVHLQISSEFEPVTYGSKIVVEAQIQSCPLPHAIQWWKNEEDINPDGRTILEDKSDVQNPKLIIRSVDYSGDVKYGITVTNDLGSVQNHKSLKVVATRLFISGPVVVSPSESINFKAVIPSIHSQSEAKWIMTKNKTSTEINFEKVGHSVINFRGPTNTQAVKIPSDLENIGAYQLCLEDAQSNMIKSNIINVFAYDSKQHSNEKVENCLRFFLLQDISRKAMRMKFDKIVTPSDFSQTFDEFRNNCKEEKRKNIIPDNDPVTSEDLDISLMCAILQFTTKKKNSNDRKIADDFNRIRKHRNKLSHAVSLEMATEDFNDAVLELIEVVQRLSEDDENLLAQMCEKLNSAIWKGSFMETMIDDVTNFKIKERQSERRLTQYEGKDPEQYQDEVRFHPVYDLSIAMLKNNTVAFRRRKGETGVCFMNRVMCLGEPVYVHRDIRTSQTLKFGLTSTDPAKFQEKSANLENIEYKKVSWPQGSHNACISLRQDTSLRVLFNTSKQHMTYRFKDLSDDDPLWLVIELCNYRDYYQISNHDTISSKDVMWDLQSWLNNVLTNWL